MNWTLIQEKYPKAFKFYTKKYGFADTKIAQNNLLQMLNHSNQLDRLLYDFFDEQGIIIVINYYWEGKTFCTEIWVNGKNDSDILYNTRPEAEEQAFECAFAILEERLCGKG